MDEGTRFLLTSVITSERENGGIIKAFKMALLAFKSKPELIITDGFLAYTDTLKNAFFTLRRPRTKHEYHVRWEGDAAQTNIVERPQGTSSER